MELQKLNDDGTISESNDYDLTVYERITPDLRTFILCSERVSPENIEKLNHIGPIDVYMMPGRNGFILVSQDVGLYQCCMGRETVNGEPAPDIIDIHKREIDTFIDKVIELRERTRW